MKKQKKQKKQKEVKYPLAKDILNNVQENPVSKNPNVYPAEAKIKNLKKEKKVKKTKVEKLKRKKAKKETLSIPYKLKIENIKKNLSRKNPKASILKQEMSKVESTKDIKIGKDKILKKGSQGILFGKKKNTYYIYFPALNKRIDFTVEVEKGEKFEDFFLKTPKSKKLISKKKNPIIKSIYPPDAKSPFSKMEVKKALKKARRYMTPEAQKVIDNIEKIEFHSIEIRTEGTFAIYLIYGKDKYFEYSVRIK